MDTHKIANNLKQIRLKRKLTQEALAERINALEHINTNAGQIHKLESGQRRLSDVWMQRLAQALDCRPADLICDDSPQHRVPVIGRVPGGALAEALQEPPEEFVQFSSGRPNLYALRVVGNSMSRIAPDGVYIIVDFSDNNPSTLAGKPVVFCTEQQGITECSFKIYKRNPDRFEPYSIEAGYDTLFPQAGTWKIYGRVIGMVGYVGSDEHDVRLIPQSS